MHLQHPFLSTIDTQVKSLTNQPPFFLWKFQISLLEEVLKIFGSWLAIVFIDLSHPFVHYPNLYKVWGKIQKLIQIIWFVPQNV